MVNTPLIQRLLNNLDGYVNDLRTATDITHEKYLTDIRQQRFVERTLEICVACCLDIVHHIISDQGYREPDSYSDAFAVLVEQSVLPASSLKDYQMMAQFRNKIVHYYEKIDPDQVYVIFKNKLGTFKTFRDQIDAWIARQEAIQKSKEE